MPTDDEYSRLTGKLTGRWHRLLLATVQEFIASAEPVGSHQVADHHSLGVRSAMVRNMMGELEDAGYLRQPHPSAGRVPTEKAYRYYVDSLASAERIGFGDRAQIELHYSGSGGFRDLREIMRDTSRLLALLTGQAALVVAPRLEAARLERVSFVRLREREVMAVFVAAGGVRNRLVQTGPDHSQDELDRMARYLNDSVRGRTLEQARRWIEEQLRDGRAAYDRFVKAALVLGGAASASPLPAEIYVEGSTAVLGQPEFADRQRMLELLRALDDKAALLDLLERCLKQSGVAVSIGSENSDARMAGLSVVAAAYLSGPSPLGSLAVVGPLRMDYGRVIPLVDYTARALSRVLDQ